MNIKVVGLDIAKSIFQVCVLLQDDSIAWNRKVKRELLLDKLRQLPKDCIVAMEACATAHHWARQIQSLGFKVRLIPA
ncbi:MAG: IS110 family transposase ISSba8 [Candidatus Celerinatantimonas neptuna]|nr:MAG: IS110 family transposase ISSba8 [Candidatus Celerinatantimonas neptuna]